MARAKNIYKWDKEITYQIDSFRGSWVLVTDGDQNWLHSTNENLPPQVFTPYDTPTERSIVKRKDIWNILVHFGVDKQDLDGIFKKRNSYYKGEK